MPNPAQPSDPLLALRKAQTIQPAPPADTQWMRTGLDGAVEGLKGFLGFGNDQSRANLGGQLAGAAMPFLGASGALPKLLEDIFAANPAARSAYEQAMASQMMQVGHEREAMRVGQEALQGARGSALQSLEGGKPVPIPSETGWETAIPIGRGDRAVNALKRTPSGSSYGASKSTSPGFETKFDTSLIPGLSRK